MNWDDDLQGEALEIARAEESPLRVVAGPGTGKSFALKRRVARLLQQGTRPQSIFLCTFTRTAAADLAGEMRALKVEGAESVRAGTLHSFCFEVLARADVLSATGRVSRPLLDMEVRFLHEDLKGEFGSIKECKQRLQAFNAAWSRLQHEAPGWCQDPADHRFSAAMTDWLKFHRGMLIGEVVPVLLAYLKRNPLSEYRRAFAHVLVDEFQDLNRAEQELLLLLAQHGTYAIIGDDDQSIYSFKHAHPEGIREFPSRHPGTRDQRLTTCRRCPTKVVAMANALIAHNGNRGGRQLEPNQERGDGEVYLAQWLSMADEARGVARFIKKKVEDGQFKPGEILVLAPRRPFGYLIRDELTGRQVPAHSYFTEEVLDCDVTDKNACQMAEAYTLLSLLANHEDRVSLRVWCGLGHGELRQATWRALRDYCS